MKYLVTGATGLLGNNIVRHLLDQGEQVRVISRPGSDTRPLAGLDIESVPGDVRDAESIRRAASGVDVVLHSAAHVHIGWTQADLHQQINVEGTRNVVAAARETGARLVYVSTINALGLGKLESPADEDSPLPGIVDCPYVSSKRESSRLVLAAAGTGQWATIVYPSMMFGPWDWKPSSGRMMLEVASFAPVAPLGAANFVDVRDVAAGAVAAAKQGPSGRQYVTGGHNMTYFDLWKRMAQVAGRRGPRFRLGPIARWVGSHGGDALARFRGREGKVNSATIGLSSQQHCFSSARAERELGYRIRPLEDTLRDTWAWFSAHGYVK